MATEEKELAKKKPDDDRDLAKKKPAPSWTSIQFTPFVNDALSTLIPHYTAHFILTRSDGEVFRFPLHAISSQSPLATGDDLTRLFNHIETYRTCSCTSKKKCLLHEVIQ